MMGSILKRGKILEFSPFLDVSKEVRGRYRVQLREVVVYI